MVVGRCSLLIYLVHVIFCSGFRIIMQYAFDIENSAFHLILGTLVGVFASLIFASTVKRMGFNFLFRFPENDLFQKRHTS